MEIAVDREGEVTVIRLSGEVDASNSAEAGQRLREAAPEERPRVVLDMSDLRFLDSSGLAALIAFLKDVDARGGQAALARLQPTVHRIFELTRLDQVFHLYSRLEEALQHLGVPGAEER